MFFALLMILLWALLATNIMPDTYGWLMLVGTGWVAGYLDSRFFSKNDTDRKLTLPDEDRPETDADLFQN